MAEGPEGTDIGLGMEKERVRGEMRGRERKGGRGKSRG
jgi:hypothetical protein